MADPEVSVRHSRMDVFDFDETFGDDYLHFYLPMLTPERNEADAAEIVAALDLTEGQRVLDAPCGHGRISNLLARAGMRVVGVDRSELFLEVARRDATLMGVEIDYRPGDLTALESTVGEQFDAVINWFTSFGYHDDDTLRSILAAYRNVLRPGGKLLIETLHHDWFVRHHVEPPFTTVTALATGEVAHSAGVPRRTTARGMSAASTICPVAATDGPLTASSSRSVASSWRSASGERQRPALRGAVAQRRSPALCVVIRVIPHVLEPGG